MSQVQAIDGVQAGEEHGGSFYIEVHLRIEETDTAIRFSPLFSRVVGRRETCFEHYGFMLATSICICCGVSMFLFYPWLDEGDVELYTGFHLGSGLAGLLFAQIGADPAFVWFLIKDEGRWEIVFSLLFGLIMLVWGSVYGDDTPGKAISSSHNQWLT